MTTIIAIVTSILCRRNFSPADAKLFAASRRNFSPADAKLFACGRETFRLRTRKLSPADAKTFARSQAKISLPIGNNRTVFSDKNPEKEAAFPLNELHFAGAYPESSPAEQSAANALNANVGKAFIFVLSKFVTKIVIQNRNLTLNLLDAKIGFFWNQESGWQES